jgi:LuxR family transcriptional regulator, maltose regulon positive regulatory protein
VPELLERHPPLMAAHSSLVDKVLRLRGRAQAISVPDALDLPPDQLTEAEQRVLHYLPSHLTATEIAGELFVSANTVRTHMRHLYAKLGVHRRSEAIERARDLGLVGRPGYSPNPVSSRA